jgi:hypothetical protein
MLEDMGLAGGVYREMARAAALRLTAELELHYGNYWRHDELQVSNVLWEQLVFPINSSTTQSELV